MWTGTSATRDRNISLPGGYKFGDISKTIFGGMANDLGFTPKDTRTQEILGIANQSQGNNTGSFLNGIGSLNPVVGGITAGASALNAITGFGESLGLWKSPQTQLAEKNFKLQQEQYEYQKQLQKQIFEREDNAVQRQAEDMQKAGLSKTLAAGGGANAGAVVNTTAPQMQDMPTDLQRSARIQQSLDSLSTALSMQHLELQNKLLNEQVKGQVVSNKVANLDYDWYTADKVAGYLSNLISSGVRVSHARSLAKNVANNAVRPIGYTDNWITNGNRSSHMRQYVYND